MTTENTLTEEKIKAKIKQVQYHQFPGTTLTVCALTLQNGYNVIGESACVDPANFNKEMGENIAYERAVNKIWQLEGYLLKQRMHMHQEDWKVMAMMTSKKSQQEIADEMLLEAEAHVHLGHA